MGSRISPPSAVDAAAIAAVTFSGTTNALTGTGTLVPGKPNTVDGTGGAFTATAPAPTKVGQVLHVERVDTTSNAITVSFPTGATLRGTPGSITLPGVGAAYEALFFVAETLTSWRPVAGHKPKAWLDLVYAPIAEQVNTVASSGSALTLPATAPTGISDVTLTANCTLTFPTPVAGRSFTLRLTQDATGARTVTWPATVKWSGGVAPTLSTVAGKQDVFSFVAIDATAWLGFVAGLDMR